MSGPPTCRHCDGMIRRESATSDRWVHMGGRAECPYPRTTVAEPKGSP